MTLLKSDQQDLDLRSTYDGVFGRRLLQTDKTSLLAIGGAVYTHEQYFPQPGTEPMRNNSEGLFGLRFSTSRFKTLDVNSEAFLFPSFADLGRVRFSSQSNLQIEIVRNSYWNFQLGENYDSRPPVNAPKASPHLSARNSVAAGGNPERVSEMNVGQAKSAGRTSMARAVDNCCGLTL